MCPFSASAFIEARPGSVSAAWSAATSPNEASANETKKPRTVDERPIIHLLPASAAHIDLRTTQLPAAELRKYLKLHDVCGFVGAGNAAHHNPPSSNGARYITDFR